MSDSEEVSKRPRPALVRPPSPTPTQGHDDQDAADRPPGEAVEAATTTTATRRESVQHPARSPSPPPALTLSRGNESEQSVFWSAADLLHAAKVFSQPDRTLPVSLVTDAEQMRRVYTLIYDVLRFKPVLSQALENLKFFIKNPQFQNQVHLICLLFYDLYKRNFQHREQIEDTDPLYQEVNSLLWKYKVRLGATISRMRIKNEAYDLSTLLPQHLQNARSKVDDSIVCGWINFFKTKPKDVFEVLDRGGMTHLPPDMENLLLSTYKLDHLLPRFLHCRPLNREDFTQTSLFAEYKVIMQERTFCLGPAAMSQLITDLALTGSVAQTHVSSLVTVAYLANLLATNERVDGLLVFGAGDRKQLYDDYLSTLGVINTKVYAENFIELPPESNLLDNVVSVLATPPNTNSNVVDPVDLAVARGGDLDLLQQLTSECFTTSGNGQVLNTTLDEQRDTLRKSMSKPQIQFVIYETHSRYDLENSEMVVRVITEMNGYATEKHMEEQRRNRCFAYEAFQSAEGALGGSTDLGTGQAQRAEDEQPTREFEEFSVNVPPCDLFELCPLPDLCPEKDNCLKMDEEGTYIAVIKRKEVTRLDPKYMIQMAEARGLFGHKGEVSSRRQMSREARRKAAMKVQRSHSGSDTDKKERSKIKVEIDRIAAPTYSSNLRDIRNKFKKTEDAICPRHKLHLNVDESVIAYKKLFDAKKVRKFKGAYHQNEVMRRLCFFRNYKLYRPPTFKNPFDWDDYEQEDDELSNLCSDSDDDFDIDYI